MKGVCVSLGTLLPALTFLSRVQHYSIKGIGQLLSPPLEREPGTNLLCFMASPQGEPFAPRCKGHQIKDTHGAVHHGGYCGQRSRRGSLGWPTAAREMSRASEAVRKARGRRRGLEGRRRGRGKEGRASAASLFRVY